MPKTEAKTFSKSFSVTDQCRQQLQEIMEKHGLLNESDAMRRSVAEFHKLSFPDYIYKKSAKDIAAREKVKTTKQLDAMSDLEYAEKFIGKMLVAPSDDGHDYIIIHGLSNMLTAVRDDKIKKYVEDYPDLVELHQKKVGETSVASELDRYMVDLLKAEYGINFDGNLPEDSKAYEQLNAKQE